MGSLAEKLDPPFYAAILNENHGRSPQPQPEEFSQLAPTDEMVSLAPGQPGFLGLETSEDPAGKWVAVSYWRDMETLKAWEQRGDFAIRKRFGGAGLNETCALRITKIDKKIRPTKQLRAPEPVSTPHSASLGTIPMVGVGIIGLFTALAGFLGYEQHIG